MDPPSPLSAEADHPAWKTLCGHLPLHAQRLSRLQQVEDTMRNRAIKKRRLNTSLLVNPAMVTRTLRLFIHHTYDDSTAITAPQPGPDDASTGGGVQYTLLIEGGVLEGDKISPYYKLSNFFEKVVVSKPQQQQEPSFSHQLPEDAEKDGDDSSGWTTIAEWMRPPEVLVPMSGQSTTPGPELDGIQMTARYSGGGKGGEGKEGKTVSIALHRRFEPGQQRYRLTPELARFFRLHREERLSVVEGALFDYIKTRRLCYSDRPVIVCDAELAKLFGCQALPISMVAERLSQHLQPPEPVVLEYTLTPHHPATRVLDMKVDIPPDLQRRLNHILVQGHGEGHEEDKLSKVDLQVAATEECVSLDRKAGYLTKLLEGRLRRLQTLDTVAREPHLGLTELLRAHEAHAQGLGEDFSVPLVLPGLLSLLSKEAEEKEKQPSTPRENLPWLQEAIRLYLNEAAGGGTASS